MTKNGPKYKKMAKNNKNMAKNDKKNMAKNGQTWPKNDKKYGLKLPKMD